MSTENPYTSQRNVEEINLKELLYNYLRYWPWIVASVFVFAVGGYFYVKSQVNIYESKAAVLVKDDKKGGLGMDLDIFSDLGIGGGNSNVYNEIEVFNSRTIIRDVVRELGLQETILLKTSAIQKDVLYYKELPFSTNLSKKELDTLPHSVRFDIKVLGNNLLYVQETYSTTPGVTEERVHDNLAFDDLIKTSVGDVLFHRGKSTEGVEVGNTYELTLRTLENAVDAVKENLTIEAVNKDASAIQIKHKGPVIELNNDIINTIILKHEQRAILDKNEVTESTSDFIKERMLLIEKELSSVEDSSEAFKFKNRLIDVETDAAMFLTKESELEKSITEVNIQLSLAEFMNEFIQKAKGYDELLPANLGFEDVSIANLTAEHNKLVLERNRLLESSSAKNPMVANIDGQIVSIRASLKESLNKLGQSLELQLGVLKKQEAIYKGKLANVPEYEREYREILRQQQIKETLYLYLLQKREENEIAMASTLGSVKVLDHAYTSREPIAPKKKIIFLGAVLLGLILPIGVIYVKELLDTKIKTKEEVDRTGLPFIGQIPAGDTSESLVATPGNRSAISEAFRMLRTNMSFLIRQQDAQLGKVIFSTSTIAGEGKTFTALNLANSLALSDKKVVLLGLDLRAPKISEYLLERNENGVTDFIVNQGMSVESIIRKGKGEVQFDYILSGSIPPNPSELLLSERLGRVFDFLKTQYEYIVVDTAPVGLVVDTISILDYADVLLYVVRANYLDKNALEIPVKLAKDKGLKNIALVLNGVKMSNRTYGTYGYGYGYGHTDKSFWQRLFKN
ncbi:MAG: polysaccharide biosynthesis tyrosine autokinase [Crocinitomicaceae bacterium]|nr:polysaccharide biosynthesis tyrosine autokinase [Crocinitomicaceae bacterium]